MSKLGATKLQHHIHCLTTLRACNKDVIVLTVDTCRSPTHAETSLITAAYALLASSHFASSMSNNARKSAGELVTGAESNTSHVSAISVLRGRACAAFVLDQLRTAGASGARSGILKEYRAAGPVL